VPNIKPKNRRYVGAKFSEFRLKRIVQCFARNMTVKDTAKATGFSENTVSDVFMRIRERLYRFGFMRVQRDPAKPVEVPARFHFRKKHRGTPEQHHLLFEAEFLHRVIMAQQLKGFEKLKASNPDDMKRARALDQMNAKTKRYNLIEVRPSRKSPDGKEQRPFDPSDYDSRSIILVNEVRLDPHAAFFDYIWRMLLKHPL
jgi:hypothetical protein